MGQGLVLAVRGEGVSTWVVGAETADGVLHAPCGVAENGVVVM